MQLGNPTSLRQEEERRYRLGVANLSAVDEAQRLHKRKAHSTQVVLVAGVERVLLQVGGEEDVDVLVAVAGAEEEAAQPLSTIRRTSAKGRRNARRSSSSPVSRGLSSRSVARKTWMYSLQ
jgi:hypothetical protein